MLVKSAQMVHFFSVILLLIFKMRTKRIILLAILISVVGVACSTVKADALISAEKNSTPPIPIPANSTPTLITPPISSSDQAAITPTPEIAAPQPAVRIFDEFVNSIKNGDKNKVAGIYVENKLALRVVYQPANDAAFVSSINGVATYFLLPYSVARNHGFLAHNFLSGALFFDLKPGDTVQVIWGDGSYEDFEVLKIREFQALSPMSPRSDFVDLLTGEKVKANTLFIEIYKGDFHIALQTCITRNDDDSWGRHFVLAPPIN
jgi:hypothetical protein